MNDFLAEARFFYFWHLEKNISWLSLSLTNLGLAFFLIYVLKNSVSQKIGKILKITRNSTAVLLFIFYFSTFIDRYDFSDYHYPNMIGLCFYVFILAMIRSILDYFDLKSARKKSFIQLKLKQNLRDTFWNIIVVMGMYTSTMYSDNKFYRYSGYILCVFNIFRMVKYRFFDDFFVRETNSKKSYLGHKSNPQIALFQSLLNLILRAYFWVTVSFACIFVLLTRADYNIDPPIFSISKASQSGNITLDFIYFSVITISTVGYGDISPVNWIARLLCIHEILLGYLFIGTLLALLVGKYNPSENEPN